MDATQMNIKTRCHLIFRIKRPLFAVTLLAVLTVFGCAQKSENYKPPSIKASESGLSAAAKFRAVAVADLDNDGKLDVVGGASSPGVVTVSYGDGRGGISAPLYLPVQGDVPSVAVADVNEDGMPDIVCAVRRQSSGIKVWLNRSDRRWEAARGPIEINKYEAVRMADVNGDGHMDIIAANATSATQGGIQVWLGDGRGGWPVESGPTVTGIYMDVMAVDLNGDGNLDLVGAGWGTYGALRIWLGDGAGNWSSARPLAKGSFYGLSTGDLNGDGNLDVFAGSHRRGVRLFEGDGRGNFIKVRSPEAYFKRQARVESKTATGIGETPPPEKNASYWSVQVLDLNEDGRADVLAGSVTGKGIKAWLSQKHSGWQPLEGLFPSSGNYYEITLADLDDDGHTDICAASFGEGIKIWSGKNDTLKIARQRQVDRAASRAKPGPVAAPRENNVYRMINGVAEYRIGPDDILEITLWEGTTPKKEEILVRPDGKISFGFVQDLFVKGLTPSELDRLLTASFKEYVRNPRIDVVVKKHDSKFVRLVGAVAYYGPGSGPGRYNLRGKTTVLDALTRAGGPAKDANLRNVRIRHQNGQIITLNLYKTILQGDLTQNPVLDAGDLVFLPTLKESGNRIYVFGEVEKPGAYTFSGAQMHLLDVIAEAGGATVFASASNTKIVRGDPTRPEIMNADLKQLIEQGDQSQNIVLADGDLVYVPRNGFGEIKLFQERIRPLFDLVIYPARTINEWDRANDVFN